MKSKWITPVIIGMIIIILFGFLPKMMENDCGIIFVNNTRNQILPQDIEIKYGKSEEYEPIKNTINQFSSENFGNNITGIRFKLKKDSVIVTMNDNDIEKSF